jgi:hypothetical protein
MEQRTVNNYSGMYSTALYNIDSVVYTLSGEISCIPTRTSIEIGPNKHIEDKLGIYINHSFKPSCRIENGCVVAEKEIDINDEITFNYNVSETKMATPFVDTDTNVLVSGHN